MNDTILRLIKQKTALRDCSRENIYAIAEEIYTEEWTELLKEYERFPVKQNFCTNIAINHRLSGLNPDLKKDVTAIVREKLINDGFVKSTKDHKVVFYITAKQIRSFIEPKENKTRKRSK